MVAPVLRQPLPTLLSRCPALLIDAENPADPNRRESFFRPPPPPRPFSRPRPNVPRGTSFSFFSKKLIQLEKVPSTVENSTERSYLLKCSNDIYSASC